MQQLEITGNLCHSLLSSSYKNGGGFGAGDSENLPISARDSWSSCGLFAALAGMLHLDTGSGTRLFPGCVSTHTWDGDAA